jgi:hypothetical protein
LDVIEYDRCSRTENEAGSTAIEDFVRLYWELDSLDDQVGEVTNFDELRTYTANRIISN